jgi:hypothetical protein
VPAVGKRLLDAAPRIPVRDQETLRRHFPGSDPERIADRLISGAAKATAAVGAGVGAAAMLPTPPAMAAEIAGETFAVAAVEFKLIAELHELYGLRAPGNARQRATVYLVEWARRRGVESVRPAGLDVALGFRARRDLRRRVVRRGFRHLPTLTPFMLGAAIGATMNRRDTRRLAQRLRADLRATARQRDAGPTGPGDDADA